MAETDHSKQALAKTVTFLRSVFGASDLEGSRGRLDIFSDRLLRAVSNPTLARAMNSLVGSVRASATKIGPLNSAIMLQVSSSESAPRVLRWLREQTRLAAMVAGIQDESIIAEVLGECELPSAFMSGVAVVRRPFAVPLTATCESALSHGAEGKAGNATLFRRIQVLATNGSCMELPYYGGNAVRGQVRDLLADHFLRSLGLLDDTSKAVVSKWFFYALYSGGALEEKSGATLALRKEIGDHGAIRSDGIRTFRENIPMLSMLGCALGNRVLPGHVQFGDLRPRCAEWGTGDLMASDLMAWEYLTRREDDEGHDKNHSMIVNTEVLRAGVVLDGGIDMDATMPEVERSVLGCGLGLLRSRGMLGGENRRGLGRVMIEMDGVPDSTVYEEWLATNRSDIISYLSSIDATVDRDDVEVDLGNSSEAFTKLPDSEKIK